MSSICANLLEQNKPKTEKQGKKRKVLRRTRTRHLRFLRIALHDIFSLSDHFPAGWNLYTAISRKVVGKSARDNPERHCGWFLVHCFSRKFERMAREAMDVCLHGLKESNKSRLNSYSVRNSVLITSHITFRDCRVHSFSDNLSRNNCIFNPLHGC